MVTIIFENPTPGASEDAAVSLVWYESTDGAVFVQIGTAVISALPYDVVTGKYTWALAAASTTKYQLIKSVSAGGVQSFVGSLLPPLPPNPSLQNLFGYAKDLGTQWAAGDIVTITPKGNQIVGGSVIDTTPIKVSVAANGIFSALVDKGAKVRIEVGSYYAKDITISTVDVADIGDYV